MLTCGIYLNTAWTTTVIVIVLHVNFWFGHFFSGGGCLFNLFITLGGGLEKCYIALYHVGGPKTQFLRYIICERPLWLKWFHPTSSSCSMHKLFICTKLSENVTICLSSRICHAVSHVPSKLCRVHLISRDPTSSSDVCWRHIKTKHCLRGCERPV